MSIDYIFIRAPIGKKWRQLVRQSFAAGAKPCRACANIHICIEYSICI